MLRINLEVTESSTRLKQIEEITVVNQNWKEFGHTVYHLNHNGRFVGEVLHDGGDGALVLARKALVALTDLRIAEGIGLRDEDALDA